MARDLEFKATLQLNSRSRAFKNKAVEVSEHAVREILNLAMQYAKDNVAPGKGPSPHVGGFNEGHNSPWQPDDTGNLGNSLKKKMVFRGFLTEGYITTDLAYGTYLEVGWRKGSHFFRYPWMKPAFLKAMGEFPRVAAARLRTEMNDLDEEEVISGATLDSWTAAAERWAADKQATEAAEQEEIDWDSPDSMEPSARRPTYVRNMRLPNIKRSEFARHDTRQERNSRLKQIRALAEQVKSIPRGGRPKTHRYGGVGESPYSKLEKLPGESTVDAYNRSQEKKLDARIKRTSKKNSELKAVAEAIVNPISASKKKKKKKP